MTCPVKWICKDRNFWLNVANISSFAPNCPMYLLLWVGLPGVCIGSKKKKTTNCETLPGEITIPCSIHNARNQIVREDPEA